MEQTSHLASKELVLRIGERLAALKLTPRAASLRTGRGPDVIRNLSRAVQKGEPYSFRTDTLQLIAAALETSPEWLLSATAPMVAQDGPLHFRPPQRFLGERDLPVYSAAEGGPGEMVVSTDPVEIVPRPWFMNEVRDGYAVLITGESMIPAFRPGEMAIVNPRLPPTRNQDTIFTAKSEELGEFRATIKHLLRWTNREWFVEQYNPPDDQEREYQLDRRIWGEALRVVGKYHR